jgi:lipopolysaccharide export system permease protein
MLRPRRLTRYVLSELASATIVGVAVWTAILMMNNFFFIARLAIQKDLGLGPTLQLLALNLPSLLVFAIPIGTLLGSLIAIGRLSADGEVVALQAAGLKVKLVSLVQTCQGVQANYEVELEPL